MCDYDYFIWEPEIRLLTLHLFSDPLQLDMTVDEIDARTTVLGVRVEASEARLQTVESNQQLILEKLLYIQTFGESTTMECA